jgi:hypothetical protein
MEMLPLFTVPVAIGVKQFDVEEANASPIPPKFPRIVTVAWSVGDTVRAVPAALRRGGVCGCTANALRTAV